MLKLRHVSNSLQHKLTLFAWKDGRVEEWEMNARPPSFHPSILPAAESVKRFLKHAELINNNYVNYVRPDICHCGGITEMKKIAAMAETNYIGVVLHNNAGPLGTAASLHAALAIANVVLLEAPWINRDPVSVSEITSPFPAVEKGYALPLEAPGLGIEFKESVAQKAKFIPRQIPKLNGFDGSVRDW